MAYKRYLTPPESLHQSTKAPKPDASNLKTLKTMKPIRIVLTLSCALLAMVSLGAFAAPPQKVTLQYDVSRNGTVMVEIVERLEHDGKSYSLTSDAKGKGIYAMMRAGTVKRSSKGTVIASGLRPEEFHDKRGDRPERTARFDWGKVTVLHGEEGKLETKPVAAPERVSDRLAMYWTFAFRPLPGKDASVSLAVADGGQFDDFRFAPAGNETIKTSAGDLETLKLVKVPDPGDERGTTIWLATKQSNLPVRILVTEKDGTRIDQVVTAISTQ